MDIIVGKEFKLNNTCVTIGKFDGIHIGHRKILDTVLDLSKQYEYVSTVFTFDFSYFSRDDEKRLNTHEEKIKLLSDMGIERCIDYPFDEETKNESPEEFAEKILRDKLDTKAIVVGDNFRFGRGAVGDTMTLEELGTKYGFKVYVIPMVEYEGSQVSSTRIRDELKAGHTAEAKHMLSEFY